MILQVEGVGNVEVTNWDEFSISVLKKLGFFIEAEIIKEIARMKLQDTGDLMQKLHVFADSKGLHINNASNHAFYIEYGTYDYWKTYGLDRFPVPGYPSIPKKWQSGGKPIKTSKKIRDSLPKGMQPFAIVRRVLHNETKMKELIKKAFK